MKLLVGLLLFSRIALAQGGPPLITDDPGTPGDGHWEISIAAAVWTGSDEQGLLQAPYADINYGWGDHVQLKYETDGAFLRESGHITDSGIGVGIAGVKYRFLDEDEAGFAMSIYPQAQFPMFYATRNPQLTDPATYLLMPLEFSKTIGRWGFDPDIGYVHSTRTDDDQLFYGLAVSYEIQKNKEVLAEMHFTDYLEQKVTAILYNVGTRWGVSDNTSLMGSVGHTLKTEVKVQPQSLVWVGVQLTL